VGTVRPDYVDSLCCEKFGDGVFTSSPIPVGHSKRIRGGFISRGLVGRCCFREVLDMFVKFFLRYD
jgi:hypothetical protein